MFLTGMGLMRQTEKKVKRNEMLVALIIVFCMNASPYERGGVKYNQLNYALYKIGRTACSLTFILYCFFKVIFPKPFKKFGELLYEFDSVLLLSNENVFLI